MFSLQHRCQTLFLQFLFADLIDHQSWSQRLRIFCHGAHNICEDWGGCFFNFSLICDMETSVILSFCFRKFPPKFNEVWQIDLAQLISSTSNIVSNKLVIVMDRCLWKWFRDKKSFYKKKLFDPSESWSCLSSVFKNASKMMVVSLHPDKNKCVRADGTFSLVSKAWASLSSLSVVTEFDQLIDVGGFKVQYWSFPKTILV